MIVYVETNFVLEIAREQEDFEAATKILTLAEESKIELAFPGFTLSECFSTVIRQHKNRNNLLESLTETLGQLRRSKSHQQGIEVFGPVLDLLKNAITRDLDSLLSVIERILSIGRPLETNVANFRQAVQYQRELDLKPQDSIIFSAVIADLMRRPTNETNYFLSRDYEAFAINPRVGSELRRYNCKYIKSFVDGLSSIEAAIRRGE